MKPQPLRELAILRLPADTAGLAQALQEQLSALLAAGRASTTPEVLLVVTEAPAAEPTPPASEV